MKNPFAVPGGVREQSSSPVYEAFPVTLCSWALYLIQSERTAALLTDEQIIRDVLSGDADAFGALVTRHEGFVAAVCRSLLADEHEALDAA